MKFNTEKLPCSFLQYLSYSRAASSALLNLPKDFLRPLAVIIARYLPLLESKYTPRYPDLFFGKTLFWAFSNLLHTLRFFRILSNVSRFLWSPNSPDLVFNIRECKFTVLVLYFPKGIEVHKYPSLDKVQLYFFNRGKSLRDIFVKITLPFLSLTKAIIPARYIGGV